MRARQFMRDCTLHNTLHLFSALSIFMNIQSAVSVLLLAEVYYTQSSNYVLVVLLFSAYVSMGSAHGDHSKIDKMYRPSSSGPRCQVLVVKPLLSGCSRQAVVVRPSLSGHRCQAVVVRPSGRFLQAVVVRPSLSGRCRQAIRPS